MLSITHFRNSIVLFVCQCYRSGFVRFWSIGPQSTLTCAGVGEAEAACARLEALPELPCAHSWRCPRRDRLGKVTLCGGNEQPTAKLCFIWEEHLGGFQELQINSTYSSLLRWSK